MIRSVANIRFVLSTTEMRWPLCGRLFEFGFLGQFDAERFEDNVSASAEKHAGENHRYRIKNRDEKNRCRK
jgi:hypothetical protein